MNECFIVRLQATKSNTSPWVIFTFLKIVQMVPNRAKRHIDSGQHVFCTQIWYCISDFSKVFNPFQANAPYLYTLKTSENLYFSEVIGGIEMEHWREMC